MSILNIYGYEISGLKVYTVFKIHHIYDRRSFKCAKYCQWGLWNHWYKHSEFDFNTFLTLEYCITETLYLIYTCIYVYL